MFHLSRVGLVPYTRWQTLGANPSIERTASGVLRTPTAAAHVER
jgi:hypothetical protein